MPEDKAIELAQRLEALEARNRELREALEGCAEYIQNAHFDAEISAELVAQSRALLKGEA